jgi:hypothetical protein
LFAISKPSLEEPMNTLAFAILPPAWNDGLFGEQRERQAPIEVDRFGNGSADVRVARVMLCEAAMYYTRAEAESGIQLALVNRRVVASA